MSDSIKLRRWIVRQGVSPQRADLMRPSTLTKAKEDPRYLKQLLQRSDYTPTLAAAPGRQQPQTLEDLL